MANSETVAVVALFILFGISIVAIAIINAIEKEKKLVEFRSKLKVGDETD
jgi:type IV secretory pathway component VirB8